MEFHATRRIVNFLALNDWLRWIKRMSCSEKNYRVVTSPLLGYILVAMFVQMRCWVESSSRSRNLQLAVNENVVIVIIMCFMLAANFFLNKTNGIKYIFVHQIRSLQLSCHNLVEGVNGIKTNVKYLILFLYITLKCMQLLKRNTVRRESSNWDYCQNRGWQNGSLVLLDCSSYIICRQKFKYCIYWQSVTSFLV